MSKDSFGRDTSNPEIKDTANTRGTGCVEGMKCPSCGQAETFHIEGSSTFVVTEDGCEQKGDTEWDSTSFARCPECDWSGTVKLLLRGSENADHTH